MPLTISTRFAHCGLICSSLVAINQDNVDKEIPGPTTIELLCAQYDLDFSSYVSADDDLETTKLLNRKRWRTQPLVRNHPVIYLQLICVISCDYTLNPNLNRDSYFLVSTRGVCKRKTTGVVCYDKVCNYQWYSMNYLSCWSSDSRSNSYYI